MGDAWREWIPRFDAWAATYDHDTGDPWLAYDAAWEFAARWLVAGLGSTRGAGREVAGSSLPAVLAGDAAESAPPAAPAADANRWAPSAVRGALHGAHVVDVGCGTGAFLRRLADLGARVTGVDPSAGMRAVAVVRVPEADVLDGHLASVPLPDRAVDALISTYAVSHLAPVEQPPAAAEMLRVVDGRGPIVIVDVPVVPPGDIPRVRDLLAANGRSDQLDWYAKGLGLDVPAWRSALERTGRRVVVEELGPLVIGLAGVGRIAGPGG